MQLSGRKRSLVASLKTHHLCLLYFSKPACETKRPSTISINSRQYLQTATKKQTIIHLFMFIHSRESKEEDRTDPSRSPQSKIKRLGHLSNMYRKLEMVLVWWFLYFFFRMGNSSSLLWNHSCLCSTLVAAIVDHESLRDGNGLHDVGSPWEPSLSPGLHPGG